MIAFGSTEPAIQEACFQLAEQRYPDRFPARSGYPVEQPDRRFYPPARAELCGRDEPRWTACTSCSAWSIRKIRRSLKSIAYTDGLPMTARFVSEAILAMEEK